MVIEPASPHAFGRLVSRLAGWTPELRQTVRTLVSVFLSGLIAHALHLHEAAWALITAVIVTQARVSSSLEAGRDQILGTLIGAVAGVVAIVLSLEGLPELPVFAVLMVPMALIAAFQPNLRLAGVTLVVVFLFPAQGGGPFSRPVDRVLTILLGAGVSLVVSYLVFRSRARRLAFQAAAAMLDTLDETQRRVLTHRIRIPEVETLNDAATESLKALVTAILEARRERLGSIERHEPLMVRLAPMLRRLQSDVLFVARASDETAVAGPTPDRDAPLVPQMAAVSEAITAALQALRTAMQDEADNNNHAHDEAVHAADRLAAVVGQLGDDAGPLPRFTLQMLSRDISDTALALRPENNDRSS
ncbi:FUSC family protein [Lichenicola sp.]|uniref:FUSC family protein n=1 Tax=Lichenicola sp. TaxID=2804529 RepID=UPI003B00E2B4